MKSRYTLIVSDTLEPSTPIYIVWGGRCAREAKAVLGLFQLADAYPSLVYFSCHDSADTDFLCRLSASFGGSFVDPSARLRLVSINAGAALTMAKHQLSALT